MRVIGGQFRGRKLVSFHAPHVRPTTDRVKESVFNILGHHLEGARVLDLFSGTGNLTCEALSRGALGVVSVELSRSSIQIMKKNFRALQIDPIVHVGDALRFVQNYRGKPFDLILCDPPFTQKLAHPVLTALSHSTTVGSHTLIMIEYSRHERLDPSYETLLRYRDCKFGDKNVAFFQIEANL